MRMFSFIGTFILLLIGSIDAWSQRERRDTAGVGSVDIISPFKPALRDLVKVQFTAQTPLPDSNRAALSYRIPSQELSITYQPGALKALAFQADSNTGFGPAQFAKLGYGSIRNPYASVALQFGSVYFYGSHLSAAGDSSFQKHSISKGELIWIRPYRSRGDWISSVFADRQVFNKYGFDRTLTEPPLDSIRNVFHDLGFRVAYRGKRSLSSGWYVEPALEMHINGDRLRNQDLNARFLLPVRYHFNDRISLQLTGMTHWGRIRPVGKAAVDASVYSLNPSLRYERPRWALYAGVRPSWDPAGVRVYPDFQLRWDHASKPWTVRLNWSGELQRVGYRDLYAVNPWLWMPLQWRNQGRVDRSVHWQYHRRAHWVYEVQAGYASLRDAYLFVNDTRAGGDGRSFRVIHADRMQNLYARGKISYRQSDRWLIRTEASWNNYTALRGVAEPWGLLPFEWKLHAMHLFPRQIRVQADLYSWFAPLYLTKTGEAGRTDGAFDLNLGAKMPVNRSVSVWLQFNNLLDRSYSRWSGYPSYGFHFVGGVVFSLDKSLP